MKRDKPDFRLFTEHLRIAAKGWNGFEGKKLTLAWGDSDYLIGKVCDAFRKTFQARPEAYYGSYDAIDLDCEQFCELTRSAGLFDPVAGYVIRRIEKCKGFESLTATLRGQDQQQNYLLLCFQGERLPARLLDEVSRLGIMEIPCFRLSSQDIMLLTAALCKRYMLRCSPSAIKYLTDWIGDDPFVIENEVVKLASMFADATGVIEPDDVAPVLGNLREDHAFKLTKLIMDGKPLAAEVLASDLIQRGESVLAIIGILTRHIRIALKIAICRQVDNRDSEISRRLQLPSFIVKSYNHYVKTVNVRSMARALSLCHEADVALKTTRVRHEDLIVGEIIAAVAPQT